MALVDERLGGPGLCGREKDQRHWTFSEKDKKTPQIVAKHKQVKKIMDLENGRKQDKPKQDTNLMWNSALGTDFGFL